MSESANLEVGLLHVPCVDTETLSLPVPRLLLTPPGAPEAHG